MARAYTKKAPQPCKVDGCERVMQGRGMCSTHYKQWHRTQVVTKIITLTPPDSRSLIMESLPGTFYDLVAESGLCYDTVVRRTHDMHGERLIHIEEYRKARMGKYMAVYAAGQGDDAKMPSERQRRKERNASQRNNHLRRRIERAGDPLVNALFGAHKPGSQRSGELVL